MQSDTTGIIIWRMNPPHIWHSELIRKSLKENNVTFVYIWTQYSRDDKNPFQFKQIQSWLSIIFQKDINKGNLFIDEVSDNPSDIIWSENLLEKLKQRKVSKNITFYWWELKNDYAITCIQNHMDFFHEYDIWFKEVDRRKRKVDIGGQKIDISATNVRRALKEGNRSIVDSMVDKNIALDILWAYK
jgi:nicotinamide mononucleotide adenylyltransferase